MLKIYYSASNYRSHRRVANSYLKILQDRCEIVNSGYTADIIVLHHEPHDFGALYRAFPILKDKYVIAYCVWEADVLPESYERSLSYVQEVWTASRYSCQIFRKYHDKVVYIPHVIERDTACSEEDLNFIREAVGHEPSCRYFLTITLTITRDAVKRKNVGALINAFLNARPRMKNARLIIKSRLQAPQYLVNDPAIVYVRQDLTDSQINALYQISDIYVSPHHSEGWGLALSDAMIFKKPVIATGYSGNLEFMNEANSFLLEFSEEYIRAADCGHIFKGHMKWAYPHPTDLEAKLVLLYQELSDDWVVDKVNRAFLDIKKFNRTAVGRLIQERLDEIHRALRQCSSPPKRPPISTP
jgi:glycosyltransferase involved in cell wall biosynthesis